MQLLPSETDDSRFNSREKHMIADSVQPFNKTIIDLPCSVCTVKYQTSVFLYLTVWYFTVQTSRQPRKPGSVLLVAERTISYGIYETFFNSSVKQENASLITF